MNTTVYLIRHSVRMNRSEYKRRMPLIAKIKR